MRFERLVIEAGTSSFSLQLHPRLTVVAGLGPAEREAIIGELLAAMGPCPSGVHLEVSDRAGRRLAVFRPDGARHRVLDVDGGTDVSDEFADDEGRIDLYCRYDLDPGDACRSLTVVEGELQADARRNDAVRRLAAIDQTDLWSAAARLRVTDDELTVETEASALDGEGDEMAARIEDRHRESEAVLATHRRLRSSSVIVGACSGAAGVLVALSDLLLSLPVFAIGWLTAGMAVLYRRRVRRAESSELKALGDAGAETYIGYHMQRVDGMLSSDIGRRRLLAAVEDHLAAAAAWAALAGDVPVDWALDHHEEITATARLRRDLVAAGDDPADEASGVADLAQALIGRLAAARTVGRGHEGFPLLLDEAFAGTGPRGRTCLLELLARDAGSPQVVLLTGDPDVAAWARMEALTGAISLLEPQAGPTGDTGAHAADADPAEREAGSSGAGA